MNDYEWSFTDGVRTVVFIPIGRAPVWKGEARTSERQLICTKISEINVFGATSPRLQLSAFLDEYDEVLHLLALDATTGSLTMDGGATKVVTLLVGEVGGGELDATYVARLTFVEAA